METEPMTSEQQDAALSRVFEKQIAFKSPQCLRVACAIVKTALLRNGEGVFPDDPQIIKVVEALAGDDKNCVGTAWRWVGKVKIMERSQARRKSTAASSHGREIAGWTVKSRSLAEAFLRRNAAAFDAAQKELLL